MQDSGTAKVKQNISNAFVRKQTAVYALCLHYSALALKYFRAEQAQISSGPIELIWQWILAELKEYNLEGGYGSQ